MTHSDDLTFTARIGKSPPNKLDRTGKIYGRWIVIKADPTLADRWLCRDLNTGMARSLSTQALRSVRQRAEHRRRREEYGR
jgi:hypothetical protein